MKIPGFLPRPLYLNKVIPFINKPLIKIFTGQRRSGKSFIMLQTIDYIRKQFPACDLIYLNKEDPGFKEVNKYIENLIFRHLIDNDYQVYVGKLGDKEISGRF